VVGYCRGYLSGARCRLAHGPADDSLSLAPVKSRLVYLSGTGSPGWSRTKRVCVVVHTAGNCGRMLYTGASETAALHAGEDFQRNCLPPNPGFNNTKCHAAVVAIV